MNEKILVGDIGGTHTRLGFYDVKTKKITNYTKFSTKKYDIEQEIINLAKKHQIKGISIGAAGPVINKTVELTNVNKKISTTNLSKKTKTKVLIINDFDALGYYVKKKETKKSLVIGAGTGLGKVFVSDKILSSEGGFMDAPFYKSEEELQKFIQKKTKKHPNYESLVSGNGLKHIKEFYAGKKLEKEEIKPENIFKNNKDKTNIKTIKTFSKFYGRFIKNSYLDFLPETVYIAGGIARKNPEILKSKEFKQEIEHEVIKKPKIILIQDKYASLIGAGLAFQDKNI